MQRGTQRGYAECMQRGTQRGMQRMEGTQRGYVQRYVEGVHGGGMLRGYVEGYVEGVCGGGMQRGYMGGTWRAVQRWLPLATIDLVGNNREFEV